MSSTRAHRVARLLAAAVVTAVSAIALSAAPANSLALIKCDTAGQPAVAVGSYDPIVNHNGVGASHQHQFFGNIAWHSLKNPNRANYRDLVAKKNNCRKVLGLAYSADSAAYWIPTLRYTKGPKAGSVIPAKQFSAYYRPATGMNGPKTGPALAFPKDTRLVGTVYNWSCGQKSGARSAPKQSIPDCTGLSGRPGQTLTAHITYPSCWDGVRPRHSAKEVGDTRDNAHYRYRIGSGKKARCPAGFKYGVTELRETIQFPYTGNGRDVALSSDHHGAAPGSSLHGDFWNTWMQPEFERLVRECVVGTAYTARKCDP